MSTGTQATYREAVLELWQIWKKDGRTFDLGKILANKNLQGDDGANGRLSEAVFRDLPERIGTPGVTTWDEESTRTLLRSLPDHLLDIQRKADLRMPHDPDQVQAFGDYYRDFTKLVLRAAFLELLFSTKNSPDLLGALFHRTYKNPGDANWCWYEVISELSAVAEKEIGIVYKYE